MKKTIAILSLFLHIICAATLSVSAHYCGAEVSDVAIGHGSTEGCGMENGECTNDESSIDEQCCKDTSVDYASEDSVTKLHEYKALAVVILNIFADALVMHAESQSTTPLSSIEIPPPHLHSHDVVFTQCFLI